MNRNVLSLDFYGNEIAAVLAAHDEETNTLRLRHALRRPVKAFSGALVRDMALAQKELSSVFAEIAGYVSESPALVIGIRGNFLSFKHTSGFKSIESRNRIITQQEIDAAVQNSVPTSLSESLEVVDILPISYTIDGNVGITNPKGMAGFTLEAETFISYALVTHLNNLNNVLSECGCNAYQLMPTCVALGESLLKPEEKQAGVLLLDIGETATSALMYHRGALVDAWELSIGRNTLHEEVAELLQNDLETTKEILQDYEMESDEIMDEVIEDANIKLLEKLKKELVQSSLSYLRYPSSQLVLCGAVANKELLKLCKKVLGVRKTRLGNFEELISDCDATHPAYAGALSLLTHAQERENNQLGVSQTKEPGLLDGLLSKLGLGQLF